MSMGWPSYPRPSCAEAFRQWPNQRMIWTLMRLRERGPLGGPTIYDVRRAGGAEGGVLQSFLQ
jgi:hypothetical protein